MSPVGDGGAERGGNGSVVLIVFLFLPATTSITNPTADGGVGDDDDFKAAFPSSSVLGSFPQRVGIVLLPDNPYSLQKMNLFLSQLLLVMLVVLVVPVVIGLIVVLVMLIVEMTPFL